MRRIPRPFWPAPSRPVRDSAAPVPYATGMTGTWSRTIVWARSKAAEAAAGSVAATASAIAASKSGEVQWP